MHGFWPPSRDAEVATALGGMRPCLEEIEVIVEIEVAAVATDCMSMLWCTTAVRAHRHGCCADVLQRDGRVLLSLDPAGACSEAAMRERYCKSARDAFLKDADAAAAVAAGGSRRRAAAHDPDSAKRARAQDILDRGPDAILMEYPEGHVPRSGT